MNFARQVGFTLVEVLVVITIIGILSAILYANFGSARDEAKNKAMQAELKETQLALELYKAQNDVYPAPHEDCDSTAGNAITATNNGCGAVPYIAGILPDYISELPQAVDAANPNCNIIYTTADDFSWYKLTAANCYAGATDAASGITQDNEFARCPSQCSGGVCDTNKADFYESLAVYSAGGQCQ